MRQLRIVFLFMVAFIKRQGLFLLAGLVVLLALLGAFFVLRERLSKPTLIRGIVGTYTEESLPDTVTKHLSKGLVFVDEAGVVKGDLAKAWEANENANEYVFKLHDNLYWSDGTKLKSSDMDLSLQNVEVGTPDDQTIKFKLVDSYSAFPHLLTKPVFKKQSLVGTGPYRVKNISKNRNNSVFIEEIYLEPNDKNLPNIAMRFFDNSKKAKSAMKMGLVHYLVDVSGADDLAGEKPFSATSTTDYSRLVAIFYNTLDPVLSDENFRVGLSFATPSVQDEVRAVTSISPKSWVFNSEVRKYLDNPQQAKVYLNKVKNGRDATITLTATPELQKVGERVVEEWNKNGVKAILRVESGIPQNFQALLIPFKVFSDPDQYDLWHSTQPQTNISKYSSPRADKDLEDGRKTADLEVRKARYMDFQKVLLDQAPATFLYFPKHNIVYMKKIEGDLKKVLDIELPGVYKFDTR